MNYELRRTSESRRRDEGCHFYRLCQNIVFQLQNKTRKITADKLEFSKKFSQLINYTKTYSSRPQFVINSPPPWRFPPAPKSQSKHSQKIPMDFTQIHSHTISTFAASAPSSGLGDSGCPAFDDSGSSAAAAGF